jgi:hypothetical protein
MTLKKIIEKNTGRGIKLKTYAKHPTTVRIQAIQKLPEVRNNVQKRTKATAMVNKIPNSANPVSPNHA